MKDFTLEILAIAPHGTLVRLLDEFMQKYKSAPTKEAWEELAHVCALIAMKNRIDEEGVASVAKNMDLAARGRDLLDPDKFKS